MFYFSKSKYCLAWQCPKLLWLSKYKPEAERTRHNLLEYCKLDTYAMVKVLEKLKETIGK